MKPSNVMVTLEGPKVIDFGIARAVDASVVTRTGSMVGSPGYMPPEQIRGEPLSGASDVFALGALLAYAATGQHAFSWDGAATHTVLYRVLHEEPALGPDAGPLTGELRALVARCLARDAGARPTLAEIGPLARERVGADFWLPASLTARLGQDAAALLEFDEPPAVPPPGPAPSTGPAPSAAPVTVPVPVPGKRRRAVLAAVAGAVAVGVALPLIALANSGGDDGGSDGAGGDPAEAPLADLLPAEVRAAGELTVWVAERHNPVLFEEEGAPVGFEVDLAVAMAQRLGVEPVFTLVDDRPTAVDGALRNSAEAPGHVVMSGFTDAPQRRAELGLDFVNHFADGFAVLSDDPGRSGELGLLCGLRVTSYDDEFLHEVIEENTGGCAEPPTWLPVPSRDDMAEAIALDEADVAVLLYSQGARYAHEHGDLGLSVALDSAEKGFRGIGVPPDQPALRDALAAAVDLLIQDGTYATLLDRWGIPESGIGTASVNGGSG
ncbi:serine/threonine-protein kinase [Streptomyces profundus]|uniref:serine/threonine-protein kinase n=1 Tax=Streptomyces profundus TaxID=2867410 RepID=UPI003CC86551